MVVGMGMVVPFLSLPPLSLDSGFGVRFPCTVWMMLLRVLPARRQTLYEHDSPLCRHLSQLGWPLGQRTLCFEQLSQLSLNFGTCLRTAFGMVEREY